MRQKWRTRFLAIVGKRMRPWQRRSLSIVVPLAIVVVLALIRMGYLPIPVRP